MIKKRGVSNVFSHPAGNPGANHKSISHRCHLFEVAFVWELTKKNIYLPPGCLQGGVAFLTILLSRTQACSMYTQDSRHDCFFNTEVLISKHLSLQNVVRGNLPHRTIFASNITVNV